MTKSRQNNVWTAKKMIVIIPGIFNLCPCCECDIDETIWVWAILTSIPELPLIYILAHTKYRHIVHTTPDTRIYIFIHFQYNRMQHTKLKPLNCLQSNAICINHQWNDCIVSLNLIELNYSRLQSCWIVLFVENEKKICLFFFYPKYIYHSCLSRLNESNCGFSRIKSSKLYDSMIFILFIMSSMMIVDTHCMKEIFQWNEHCGWE